MTENTKTIHQLSAPCVGNPSKAQKSYYSPKMAPIAKRPSNYNKKVKARRKGIIIASVTDESLFDFIEAQERVMRRVAHMNNIHVVEVYRVIGDILDSKDLLEQIKEKVGINDYEVILSQSRYRLSSDICDVLNFEIFLAEHGAEIIYL